MVVIPSTAARDPNSKRGECLNYSYVPENGPDSRRTEFIEMGQQSSTQDNLEGFIPTI
jgi:hypothetical protein